MVTSLFTDQYVPVSIPSYAMGFFSRVIYFMIFKELFSYNLFLFCHDTIFVEHPCTAIPMDGRGLANYIRVPTCDQV